MNRKYYALTVIPFLVVATLLIIAEWSNMEKRINDLVNQSVLADKEETLHLASNPVFRSLFENLQYGLEPEAEINLKEIAQLFQEHRRIAEKHGQTDKNVILLSKNREVIVIEGSGNTDNHIDLAEVVFPQRENQVSSLTKDNSHLTSVALFQDEEHVGNILIEHDLPLGNVRDREFGNLQRNLIIVTTSLAMLLFLVHLYVRHENRLTKRQIQEKDAYYKAIVDGYTGHIYISDKDHNIIFMNDRLIERTGYDGVGKKCYSVMHDLDKPCSWCRESEVFEGKTIYWQIKSPKDGRWYEVVNSPIEHVDGTISKQSMFSDITDRKLAESEILAREKKYRSLFENATDAIFIVDRVSGQYLDANVSAAQLTGRSLADLQKLTTDDVTLETGEDRREYILQEDKTIELGKITYVQPDGTRRIAILHSVPLDENSVFDIARDITSDIEHQERMRQTHKMEAIGTLAGGIAHDFNNILSAVIGYTEMAMMDIQKGSLTETNLQQVLHASARARDLVQQILTFSRKAKSKNTIFAPASLVKETMGMVRSSIPSTIEIKEDIDSDTDCIAADPTQLNQILLNLCTNAYHAMEKTGGTLSVSMREIESEFIEEGYDTELQPGKYIKISVRDTGAGIPQEISNRIFDPYFTTKGEGRGTGMGLSIVHGIVRSYGGTVTFTTTEGEGTVFDVFLPVSQEDSEANAQNEVELWEIPKGSERILLVDDEEALGEIGKNIFVRLGYEVTYKNDPFDALDAFKHHPDHFDLVITDQTMPGMTGTNLSAQLLQIRPDIPIILCTGYSNLTDREEALELGIKEFVMKPIAKDTFCRLVRSVLDANIENHSNT